MDQASTKTIMCSVFFLDIVGYSKRSVTGQISLKERFNGYLSAAIRDVPLSDRIILDTGDGAAINFMGDIEDALKAALSMRAAMLHEDPNIEPPLLVRMGINLGPVRLVRDLNGLPNIVGDGINVAQRVMGFADASQILVSRSYYDAVSRLSPKYAGMFHYQGARTDKHVREHEVYAIGYPGDKTTRPFVVHDGAELPQTHYAKLLAYLTKKTSKGWLKLEQASEFLFARYNQINPKRRPFYVALVGIPVVLLLAFTLKNTVRADVVAKQKMVARTVKAKVAVLPTSAVPATIVATSAIDQAVINQQTADALHAMKLKADKLAKELAVAQMRVIKRPAPLTEKEKAEQAANVKTSRLLGFTKHDEIQTGKAVISLKCLQGSLLFIDGSQKGRITSGALNVVTTPGKHAVIVMLPNQKLFSHTVTAEVAKKVEINPDVCN